MFQPRLLSDLAHLVRPAPARRLGEVLSRPSANQLPVRNPVLVGAPTGTRTQTGRILSPLPLPIGLRGLALNLARPLGRVSMPGGSAARSNVLKVRPRTLKGH